MYTLILPDIQDPAFTVKGPESIQAKKSAQVVVTFKGTVAAPTTTTKENAKEKEKEKEKAPVVANVPPKTGKLVVTHVQTNTSWTYYLRGVQ